MSAPLPPDTALMSIVAVAVVVPPAPSDTVYWKLPAVAPAVLPLVKLIVPLVASRVRPEIPTAPPTLVIVKARPSMSVSLPSSELTDSVTSVLFDTMILSATATGLSFTAMTVMLAVSVALENAELFPFVTVLTVAPAAPLV